MKGHVSITLAFVAIATLISLYLGCTTAPNPSNTNTVALASPEPTPDKAAIEAEVSRIENEWPRIIKERDAAGVKRIEADDVILVYPNGTVGSKEQDIKDTEAGNMTYDAWEISDLKVNVLDSDAAVATLLITVKNGKYKTEGSAPQDVSGRFRAVDTFVRRNGQWQIAASAVTKLSPEAEKALATTTKPGASPSPTSKPSPSVRPSPARKASPATRSTPAVKASPKAAASPN